jgi:uncharacterized protein (TIGR04255 family)
VFSVYNVRGILDSIALPGAVVITGHPRYPNPTIGEALCEIHFNLPEDVQWDPSFFARFYHRIEEDYPEFEPAAPVGLQLQLSSGQVGFIPLQSRVRYKHRSRNALLQLAENLLTVNVLPRYEGWTRMQTDVLQAWGWAQEVFRPTGISRVGLRYIDFIPFENPSETPGDWLAPNDYVAPAALTSKAGFLSRVETQESSSRRVIVTVGQPQSSETKGTEAGTIVLDMDCIEEGAGGCVQELEPTLGDLHELIWTVFSGFVTPRLKRLLEGGRP